MWYRINPHARLGSSRNTAAEGGIVAVYYGGTLIGALMAGSLADRCGRVKAVVFGCLWVVLGASLQASAYNITWMCFGRVLGKQGSFPVQTHFKRADISCASSWYWSWRD